MQKWRKHNLKLHRERLNSMKKMIDNSEPATMSLTNMQSNGKKAQKALERQEEIDLVRVGGRVDGFEWVGAVGWWARNFPQETTPM